MLTAENLRTIAKLLRVDSADPVRDEEERLAIGALAAEAERTADEAEGYSTAETYHAATVLGSDPTLCAQRREIVRQCMAASEKAGTSTLAICADVLLGWCAELCGMEGIAISSEVRFGCGSNGSRSDMVELPLLAHALLGVALVGVDWHALAGEYLQEAAEE